MSGVGQDRRQRFPSGLLRRRGSTLIELLVVIAIVGLLITILLPSLKRSMKLASATVCQYGLREIGHGITMYRLENDGWMPVVDPAPAVSATGGPADNAAWFVKLFPTYLQDPLILACPDDPYGHRMNISREKMRDPVVADYPSYGINSFMLTYGDGMLSNIDRHQPTRPMDTILVADLGPDEIRHTGPSATSANGPERNGSLIMWGDGYDPFVRGARPWVTTRHNQGINMLTITGGVREVRTADILRSPILRRYENCAGGGCTLCTELEWFHYSFAQQHLYWWTGPTPTE